MFLKCKMKFKEFKRIAQGKKLERTKRKKAWWHSPAHFISPFITWILVKTPITANFVTVFGIVIGLIGLLLIGLGSNFFIILGFILLYLYYLSDEVDGEIARYKKQISLRGIYYDEIGHLIFLGWFFFAIGYSIYNINTEFLYIILGAVASYLLLGVRVIRKIAIIASTKSEIRNIINQKVESNELQSSKKGFIKSIKGLIINLVNAFSHPYIIITVFFIGFILYMNFGYLQILELIMIVYTIFMFIVFTSFIIIKFKTFEKDIIKIFQSANIYD
ncbi:MAG: hypothetical protein CEE43_13390 [Promethearchaeota archaeon Loki_b32]|nr:MAG: hypothetical protein CEE43_13390 [Candidatus Lokiarchaeota archaeon Loki_b32]